MLDYSAGDSSRAEGVMPHSRVGEADAGRGLARECRQALAEAVSMLAATRERIARGATRPAASGRTLTPSECVLADWRSARPSVRDAVVEFGRLQSASHSPPERVLVLVKAAASDAGVDMLREPERSVILADVVHWSIEGYYAFPRA